METKYKLSRRRQRILDYLHEFLQDNGLPPTVRDIQKSCDISSTSVVDYNLRLLERDGFIRRRPDVSRGIELLDHSGQLVSTTPKIPIIGKIAAGLPIPIFSEADTDDYTDTVEISPDLHRKYGELFGLNVVGTSMIDALIDDGDIIIVQPTSIAANGDTIVAWLKLDEEATLKKFFLEGDTVRLQPANSQMNPIYCPAEQLEIKGRVVSVMRKF